MVLSIVVGILAILVAFLGILVTALITWQIFSLINFKSEAKRIIFEQLAPFKLKIEDDISEVIKKQDKQKHEAIGTAFYSLGCAMHDIDNLGFAYDFFIKALDETYKEDRNSPEVDLCFNRLDNVINDIYKRSNSVAMPEDTIKRHLDILDGINDSRKYNAVEFLLKFRYKDTIK